MGKDEYNTDTAMKKIWLCLVRDFRNNLSSPDFASRQTSTFLDKGVKGFRTESWPYKSQAGKYLFKCQYQLENFFKRYRFDDDLHTDECLETQAISKFVETQIRVAQPLELNGPVFLWLRKARTICSRILGEYTKEEHFKRCRFGKRACVGTPYHKSYLDLKLARSLTGSHEHIRWFQEYLETDQILKSAILNTNTKGIQYSVCDSLTLALVPKSYKSKRTILANTLLGSFYTYGLGKVIQDRLCKVGLDIRFLQKKHGYLAMKNSVSRKYVTADLSSASDSLSRELLRRILPTKWYHAITCGIIPMVRTGESCTRMSSVLTMGMGHTFPLQTLIFYCLLKAIKELIGIKGYVSVYGDDLIYPSNIHLYVMHLFPKIHLILNGDKTYVNDFFRESCGFDYFRGSDVRPSQPEGEYRQLCRKEYSVFLYRIANGLRRRWSEVEISGTLEYILSEIFLVSANGVFQVPPSFPDGSGYKTERPLPGYTFYPVRFDSTSGTWRFKYFQASPRYRVVVSQYPYYWEAHRSHQNLEDETDNTHWDSPDDKPALVWRKVFPQPKNYRSLITGRRLVKLQACTTLKSSSIQKSKSGATSEWF